MKESYFVQSERVDSKVQANDIDHANARSSRSSKRARPSSWSSSS